MTWWQIVRISCDYTLKRSCRWKCFDCPWILEPGTRCYMPSICCQHAVMFLNTWRTSSDMAGSTGNHTICSGAWGCRTSTSIWHFTITSKKPVSKACLQNKGWLMGILSSWMIIADILGTVPRHKFINQRFWALIGFSASAGRRPSRGASIAPQPNIHCSRHGITGITGIAMNWLNWHDDIRKSNIFQFWKKNVFQFSNIFCFLQGLDPLIAWSAAGNALIHRCQRFQSRKCLCKSSCEEKCRHRLLKLYGLMMTYIDV